jgi:integrase-like protein
MATLAQLGITHRRTAYHHPEGNSYIERFHRSLKEEEVWTSEYRSLAEARENIVRYLEEYNHDRPHRGVENRAPHKAFLSFAVLTKNEALIVQISGVPSRRHRKKHLESILRHTWRNQRVGGSVLPAGVCTSRRVGPV